MLGKTKRIFLSILIILISNGCGSKEAVHGIIMVQYSADSGPILPELQWHEEISITTDLVVLKRNGKIAETRVNTGRWEVPVESGRIAQLFKQLELLDWSAMARVESQDAPDGGGILSYEIVFSNGKSQSFYYDPGTTYQNDTQARNWIDAFILQLELPYGARGRYLEDYLSFTNY
jgi:hypothetical protein